jgi:hypothetical protein
MRLQPFSAAATGPVKGALQSPQAWNRAGICFDLVELLDNRPASCQCFRSPNAMGRFASIDQFCCGCLVDKRQRGQSII